MESLFKKIPVHGYSKSKKRTVFKMRRKIWAILIKFWNFNFYTFKKIIDHLIIYEK